MRAMRACVAVDEGRQAGRVGRQLGTQPQPLNDTAIADATLHTTGASPMQRANHTRLTRQLQCLQLRHLGQRGRQCLGSICTKLVP